jgi:hypothetical protein
MASRLVSCNFLARYSFSMGCEYSWKASAAFRSISRFRAAYSTFSRAYSAPCARPAYSSASTTRSSYAVARPSSCNCRPSSCNCRTRSPASKCYRSRASPRSCWTMAESCCSIYWGELASLYEDFCLLLGLRLPRDLRRVLRRL